MKQLFLTLTALLKTVPALRFIDLDKGQLEYYTERPAVAFPCALMNIQISRAENLGGNVQRCFGSGTIRLAFDYQGETAGNTPDAIKAQSLEFFDTVQAVYLAVQGKQGGNGKFDRQSVKEETRRDGLKVISIPFNTNWIDKSASTPI